MRYKSRVQQLAGNLENLLENLRNSMQKGELSERDVLDISESALGTTKKIVELIDLEDEDFDRTAEAPAPGSKNAPTPRRSNRRTQPKGNTKRVSDTSETNETSRVETEGGHNRKKRTTKRVEFDKQ